MSEPTTAFRIFLSYCWTSEEHSDWILELATRFVDNGVDVVLDQWDLKKGDDKYVFMEKMVTDPTITKVICVCDARYGEKANNREGGVGTESQIISKEVYDKVSESKFVAIIRDGEGKGEDCLPIFFRNRIYIDFSEDSGFEDKYDELLRDIVGRPAKKKPPLGKLPAHLLREDMPFMRTTGMLHRLRDSLAKQRPNVQSLLQDYLDAFLVGMEDFRLEFNRNSDPPFDEMLLANLTAYTPYRDEFVDFITSLAGHRLDETAWDSIHEFLETFLSFQHRPNHLTGWNESSYDNYRFMHYELFLYLITALLKSRQHERMARFIEDPYMVAQSVGGSEIRERCASAFWNEVGILDAFRAKRLQLNRVSVIADVVKERATHPKISFEDLAQTDFMLYLRPYFPEPGRFDGWGPKCFGYLWRSDSLPIFAKATTDRGLEPLKWFFRVKTHRELVAAIEDYMKNPRGRSLFNSGTHPHVDVGRLLNYEELKHRYGSENEYSPLKVI